MMPWSWGRDSNRRKLRNRHKKTGTCRDSQTKTKKVGVGTEEDGGNEMWCGVNGRVKQEGSGAVYQLRECIKRARTEKIKPFPECLLSLSLYEALC